MNEYRIQTIKLLNFCGIQSLEITPGGDDLTVYGDNAESVTALTPSDGQAIRLIVSEADKALRFET